MKAVDLLDQRTSYYDIDRRSKKNWFRIFQKFVEIVSFNSYLCFIDKTGSKVEFIEYLKDLSKSLVSTYSPLKRIGRPIDYSAQKKARILKKNHDDQHPPQLQNHLPHAYYGSERHRCSACSTSSKPVKTIFYCNFCNLSFCINRNKNCFANHHHSIVHLPQIFDTSKPNRCSLCSTSSKQVNTIFYCKHCCLPFCIKRKKNCFAIYHNDL